MKSEEYDKLTDKEKQEQVALCAGLEEVGVMGGTVMHIKDNMFCDVPDYLNDLNACHEFEKSLSEADYLVYVNVRLSTICEADGNHIVSATAEQRCKAFVLTMGEGKD